MGGTEQALLALGFLKGGIVETIVSTYSPEGVPDAAPMGVTLLDSCRVMIRPYTSTLTFRNIQAKQYAVINVTSDPFLFLRTALKELNPSGILPSDLFQRSKLVDAPRLKGSEAFLEVSLYEVTFEDGERADVTCNIELIEVFATPAKAYCRASSALIEAAIHATRVKELVRSGQREQAERHEEMMQASLRVVEKVASKSAYAGAATELKALVERLTVPLRSRGM